MKTLYRALLLLVLGVGIGSIAVAAGGFQATPEGLRYRELRVGPGDDVVASGDVVVMHFVGWLAEDGARGRELLNTRNRGRPVSFVVGTDRVMEGWNLGVVGMRTGGQRLLLVPPGLAYRDRNPPPEVPRGSSLMFLIELVAVEKAK
jgi:FKBP-type peptidyl-prolyl cis-trans isomerase